MTEGPEPPLLEFLEVMRRLRAECPWKAEQTHRSLARYLLEETHETLEAIDSGDSTGDWSHLREELGDLLLQVYFHAVIAEERGAFTIDDVARDITAKMHRRNPHVFGDPGADPPARRPPRSTRSGRRSRPRRSSATRSPTASRRPCRRCSTRPRPSSVARSVSRRRASGERDLGDRLLALVAEAVGAGVDPEQALRDAVRGEPPPVRAVDVRR